VIIIQNLLPRADVRLDQGEHPLEIVFIALAEDDDGDIASFNWSFGDGSFGTGASATHRYQQEGSYDIVLTVVDDASGVAEARYQATVSLSSISLSSPELRYEDDRGWTLYGEMINEGAVPVQVTLFVDAGGIWFLKEYNITGGSSTPIDLPLTNFEGGNVTVRVLTPDGWDSDMQDNVWTTFIEHEEPFPYWLIGVAVAVIAVTVVALYIRRME
jgi:PKD repeat protein